MWARLPRYNATLDLVPYAKSQCGGWNATLPTQEDPFTPLRDRWEGKGQSEAGFYLRERLWTDVGGVISTLALPFATTTVLRVRSANPFNAGVGRRRSRCGVAWANQPIVSWKGTSMPGFSTAASTNAGNHAIVLLLNHPNAHPPHLMLPTVLVGRAPSHRLPPLRDLSIHSPPLRSHPHLHLPFFESPHGALIHAKRNATLGPAYHTQSRSRARADVEERRAVFPATKSIMAVLVTNQQKRARSSAIAHAPFSALVVDINVLGCVVPAFSCYLSPRKRSALGQGREIDMGKGLGKSRGVIERVC